MYHSVDQPDRAQVQLFIIQMGRALGSFGRLVVADAEDGEDIAKVMVKVRVVHPLDSKDRIEVFFLLLAQGIVDLIFELVQQVFGQQDFNLLSLLVAAVLDESLILQFLLVVGAINDFSEQVKKGFFGIMPNQPVLLRYGPKIMLE